MSNQIVITSGAKLRDLDDVIIGTDGILSSVAFNVANGVPRLDENGKILVSQLPNSVMEFKGVWNASTNSPTLVNGTGNAGDVWLCNVAGTVDFGAGPIAFAVGDYAVYTGTVWARSSGATGTVTSVGVSRDGNALTITGSPVTTSGTINLGFSGDNTQYINGAGNLTTFPTLITSIGLTMPAAFNVSNSPLTANGTIGVAAAGYASQYIRGDGTLADFPSSGGGGSSVSYYFNGGTSQGTIGGTTYYEMSKTADTGTGVDFNKTGDGFIVAFLTDANDPNLLQIPAGNWDFEIYASMSSNGGTPELYAELYKYDGTTFTLIATSSHEILYDGVNLNLYSFATAVPQTSLTVTDRLAIKLYADNSGGKTTTIHTQDSHLCQVITTFSTGLTALNGLTAQVQYFGTGTSGSDFNIVSSVATHTFNIPSASATARGLITTGTQTIAGSKTITGTTTFTGGPILYETNLTYANSGYTLVLQSPTLSVNRTVTLPNGTGTLALTSDISYPVTSVFGRTGAVVATSGDYTTTQVTEGTNLYFTDARARTAISLTTTGSTGLSTYNNTTGVLNIPNYADQYVGTVTSVDMSVPTGLTVSGNPITTSGTLAVTLTAGYSIPTTANQSTWTTAYNRSLTSAAVTGTTTKTLTLNQQDGGTITASWTDYDTAPVTSVFGRTGAVVATDGDYTLTLLGDVTITSPSSGQVLKYNGTAWINDTDANTGTVTSVAMTVPTGLSIAGSPITSSGTLAVTFAAGYSIPTNASQTTWDTAYTNRITSATGPLNITSNVISISQSSGSTNGYLSSADWTTFNNKQAALTNPVTGSGSLNKVAKFTATGSTIGDSIITDNGTNVWVGAGTGTDSRMTINQNTGFASPVVLRVENDSITQNESAIRLRANSTGGSFAHADIGVYATGVDTGKVFIKFPYSDAQQTNVKFSITETGVVDMVNYFNIINSGGFYSLIKSTGASQSVGLNLGNNNIAKWGMHIQTTDRYAIFNYGTSSAPLSIDYSTNYIYVLQRIGVGISSPTAALEINGSGFGDALAIITSSANGADIKLNNTGTGGNEWHITSTGTNNVTGTGNLQFYNSTDNITRFVIKDTSEVGVSINPKDWGGSFRVLQIGQTGSLHQTNTGYETRVSNNLYWDGTDWRRLVASYGSMLNLDNAGGFTFYAAATGTAETTVTLTTPLTVSRDGNGVFLGTISASSLYGSNLTSSFIPRITTSGQLVDSIIWTNNTQFAIGQNSGAGAILTLNQDYTTIVSPTVFRLHNSHSIAQMRTRATNGAYYAHADVGVYSSGTGVDEGYWFVKFPFSDGLTNIRLKIDHTGAATFSSSVTAASMFINTTDNSLGSQLQIFGSINVKGSAGYNGWAISQSGGSSSAAFNLSYGAGGATNVITAQYDNGNVGIGTANDEGFKFYVNNGVSSSVVARINIGYTGGGVFGGLDICRSGTNGVGNGSALVFSANNSANAVVEYGAFACEIESNTGHSGALTFLVTDGSSLRQRKMMLSSAGNLIIGTSAPVSGEKLRIVQSGDNYFLNMVESSSSLFSVRAQGTAVSGFAIATVSKAGSDRIVLNANGESSISAGSGFSSSGNYGLSISNGFSPSSGTFNNGGTWAAANNYQAITWGSSSVTVNNGAVIAGFNAINRNIFNTAGVSVTVNQSGTGIRAISAFQILQQTGGTNAGTISHGASMFIQGIYPTNTSTTTFTNYYGLLLNALDEWQGSLPYISITNRWGIYQAGSSDKNYFAGIMQKPNQPTFSVRNSASITINADAKLPFDTEYFDVGNNYNTSLYRFTAPYTGKYLITFEASMVSGGTQQYNAIYILKNGAGTNFRFRGPSNHSSGDWFGISGSVVMDLTAGDYLELSGYTASNSMTVQSGEGCWSGYYLG